MTALADVVGRSHVLTDPELCASYETDWTGRFAGKAAAVVRPGSTAEVAAVMALLHEAGRPVVPQGGNTGLVGGGVPLHGEVVVSLRRLAAIEPVDVAAGQLTAGAGATLAAVDNAAAPAGLAFGVDLAARDSATVGGMVATNAGGLRMLRYGGMRAQTAGVEAVLADGRVLSHLGGLAKDNTGYDLAGLLAGSEGTLAVVTRLRLRLVPRLEHRTTGLLAFADADTAVEALVALRRRLPGSLEAVELFLADGVALVCDHLGIAPPFGRLDPVYLLVEAAGTHDPTDELAEAVVDGVGDRALDGAVESEPSGRARLWRYREAHTEAINAAGVPAKLDVTLPAGELAFEELAGAFVKARFGGRLGDRRNGFVFDRNGRAQPMWQHACRRCLRLAPLGSGRATRHDQRHGERERANQESIDHYFFLAAAWTRRIVVRVRRRRSAHFPRCCMRRKASFHAGLVEAGTPPPSGVAVGLACGLAAASRAARRRSRSAFSPS